MLRVDGAYLYEFGRIIRSLGDLEENDTTALHLYFRCSVARNALENMIYQSIFAAGWRTVHKSAKDLLEQIDGLCAKVSDQETYDLPVKAWQVGQIKAKFKIFESIITAELQTLALYYVSPKGGFDNRNLIDDGTQLFPSTLIAKAPEAHIDVLKGARCMAFELWTAMGFHFLRANEAVLRRYYKIIIEERKQPKHLAMGTMISSMEQANVGDVNIRAALKNITVFHRNPIAHPDHHIDSGDDALSLYAAIRAAMGYMLDKLPDVDALIGIDSSLASPQALTAMSAQ